MKLTVILISALAVLSLILFCTVLISLPSVTLYDAKDSAFSDDHLDPSTKALMTTNEADVILPLMEESMKSSEKAVPCLVDLDMASYSSELASYSNYVKTLEKNINKLNLSRTDFHRFWWAADNMGLSLQFLKEDYEQALLLMEQREKNLNNPKELANINNELILIAAEVKSAIELYAVSASTMIRIGDEFGLDTSSLMRAIELLNIRNIVAGNTQISKIISGITYGPSQIYFVINPTSGFYGDEITVSGTAKAGTHIQIFCDRTVWGYADVNENGVFNSTFIIGRIPAGTHQITLTSETQISKSAVLTINPLNTNLNILFVTPSDAGDRIVITGFLKTSTDIPVVGAPVSIINTDDGVVLSTGIADMNGYWTTSAVLPMGTYNVYAYFSDSGFPLYESRSSTVTFTVFGSQIYIILLLLLVGSAGFIILRTVKKRKSRKQISTDGKSRESVDEIVTQEEEDIPEPDCEPKIDEDEKLFREMEEFEARSEQDFLSGVPMLPSQATISNSEDIWTMYRCVAASLAVKYNLSFVEAKTPRELLASVENAGDELSQYLSEYEFIRYSGAAVTPDEFVYLKELALSIPEIAEGGNV